MSYNKYKERELEDYTEYSEGEYYRGERKRVKGMYEEDTYGYNYNPPYINIEDPHSLPLHTREISPRAEGYREHEHRGGYPEHRGEYRDQEVLGGLEYRVDNPFIANLLIQRRKQKESVIGNGEARTSTPHKNPVDYYKEKMEILLEGKNSVGSGSTLASTLPPNPRIVIREESEEEEDMRVPPPSSQSPQHRAENMDITGDLSSELMEKLRFVKDERENINTDTDTEHYEGEEFHREQEPPMEPPMEFHRVSEQEGPPLVPHPESNNIWRGGGSSSRESHAFHHSPQDYRERGDILSHTAPQNMHQNIPNSNRTNIKVLQLESPQSPQGYLGSTTSRGGSCRHHHANSQEYLQTKDVFKRLVKDSQVKHKGRGGGQGIPGESQLVPTVPRPSSRGALTDRGNSIEHRLMRKGKERGQKMVEMRAAKQAEEIKELRQKPQISKRSEELAQTHRVAKFSNKIEDDEEGTTDELIQRFKRQERIKQTRLNEEREQTKLKEMQEFTGRPQINQRSREIIKDVGDLMNWEERKRKRAEEERIQRIQDREKNFLEMSQRHTFSENSFDVNHRLSEKERRIPIEKRLLEKGEKSKKMKENLIKENYEKISFSPSITKQPPTERDVTRTSRPGVFKRLTAPIARSPPGYYEEYHRFGSPLRQMKRQELRKQVSTGGQNRRNKGDLSGNGRAREGELIEARESSRRVGDRVNIEIESPQSPESPESPNSYRSPTQLRSGEISSDIYTIPEQKESVASSIDPLNTESMRYIQGPHSPYDQPGIFVQPPTGIREIGSGKKAPPPSMAKVHPALSRTGVRVPGELAAREMQFNATQNVRGVGLNLDLEGGAGEVEYVHDKRIQEMLKQRNMKRRENLQGEGMGNDGIYGPSTHGPSTHVPGLYLPGGPGSPGPKLYAVPSPPREPRCERNIGMENVQEDIDIDIENIRGLPPSGRPPKQGSTGYGYAQRGRRPQAKPQGPQPPPKSKGKGKSQSQSQKRAAGTPTSRTTGLNTLKDEPAYYLSLFDKVKAINNSFQGERAATPGGYPQTQNISLKASPQPFMTPKGESNNIPMHSKKKRREKVQKVQNLHKVQRVQNDMQLPPSKNTVSAMNLSSRGTKKDIREDTFVSFPLHDVESAESYNNTWGGSSTEWDNRKSQDADILRVALRNEAWLENRERKLAARKEELRRRELKDETFAPHFYSRDIKFSHNNKKEASRTNHQGDAGLLSLEEYKILTKSNSYSLINDVRAARSRSRGRMDSSPSVSYDNRESGRSAMTTREGGKPALGYVPKPIRTMENWRRAYGKQGEYVPKRGEYVPNAQRANDIGTNKFIGMLARDLKRQITPKGGRGRSKSQRDSTDI